MTSNDEAIRNPTVRPSSSGKTSSKSERDEPFAYRDVSERLPNEALREELLEMSAEEREAYLRYLEELSEQYLGPGGP